MASADKNSPEDNHIHKNAEYILYMIFYDLKLRYHSHILHCRSYEVPSKIIDAVCDTRFLMRDYLRHFFEFTSDERTFRSEVKCLWNHWISQRDRDNVFVQTIDTFAIITEAFLFCHKHRKFNKDIYHASRAIEWFMEWFQEHLKLRFHASGGWKKFSIFSTKMYSLIHGLNYTTKFDEKNYGDFIYSINAIGSMRRSPIFFPLPRDLFGFRFLKHDDDFYRDVVYVRLKDEEKYNKALKLSESFIKMSIAEAIKSCGIKSEEGKNVKNFKMKFMPKVSITSKKCTSPSEVIQRRNSGNLHIVHDPSPFVDLENLLLRHYGERDTFNSRKLIFLSDKYSHSFDVFRKAVSKKNIKLLSITEYDLKVETAYTKYFFASDGSENSVVCDDECMEILTSVYPFYYIGSVDEWNRKVELLENEKA